MIGFIGGGNMGTALVGGILKQRIASPNEMIVADLSAERLNHLRERFGVSLTNDNKEAAAKADILFLSIKPQQYEAVIREIRDFCKEDQVVVTIAPGKTISWLQEMFGGTKKIVRCMPNTPALVGEGMMAICPGSHVSAGEVDKVKALLSGCGEVEEVAESMMDAVVALSGSSPAYVFMLLDAMVRAAVKQGMDHDQAYRMACQAVLGSAKLAKETGIDPDELKVMVCSPGGTTIEAVKVLEDRDLYGAVGEAMDACAKRSSEL